MGLEAPMILETTLRSIKKGYEYSDMGWVLENNTVMLKTIERVGASSQNAIRFTKRRSQRASLVRFWNRKALDDPLDRVRLLGFNPLNERRRIERSATFGWPLLP